MREERDGAVRDDARSIERAAFEQHLREAREVGRGGEQTRVSGDASERVRIAIVHLALERVAASTVDLGWRGARAQSAGAGR